MVEHIPLSSFPVKLEIREYIDMILLDHKWLVCVKARMDVEPRDMKDQELMDAVIRFCEQKRDWSDLSL